MIFPVSYKIRPKGLIRNPDTGDIVKEGQTVPANSYWDRRIRFGDVEILEEIFFQDPEEKKEEQKEDKGKGFFSGKGNKRR